MANPLQTGYDISWKELSAFRILFAPQIPRKRSIRMNESPSTLGVIIGNREFFPDQLVAEARQDIVKLFGELNIKPMMVSPEETKLGGIETHADARKCAELFRTIGTRSTACSSCCQTLATKKAWPTH